MKPVLASAGRDFLSVLYLDVFAVRQTLSRIVLTISVGLGGCCHNWVSFLMRIIKFRIYNTINLSVSVPSEKW